MRIPTCLLSLWKNRWFQRILWLGVIIMPLLFFYSHIRYYANHLSDDALISLRYAQRLIEGKGLTWTEGIPVEGYSNFLWVLLSAGMGLLGFDLITGIRILGMICMAGAYGAFVYCFIKCSHRQNPLFLLPALSVFVVSGTLAIWTVGGLEQPLIALLLSWSLAWTFILFQSEHPPDRFIWILGLLLGLICITRPDSPLFVVSILFIGAIRWGLRKHALKRLCIIGMIPLVFIVGQLVFRLYYYGDWVPNTAMVKVSPSLDHLLNGLNHIKNGFLTHLPLSFLGILLLAGLLLTSKYRFFGLLLFTIDVLWLSYICFIGGDIFAGFRMLLPVLIVLIYIILFATDLIWSAVKKNIHRIILVLFFIGCFLAYHRVQFHYKNNYNSRAVFRKWVWYGRDIGLFLKQAFGDQKPLLAVDAAGAVPYWSELPSLDMLGLNDWYIPRHKPDDFGRRTIAHELGNGPYILHREPDLIMFSVPPGTREPSFRGGHEMMESPAFHDKYTPVSFLVHSLDDIQAKLWVKRYSRKIGIHQTDRAVTIPGYLFNGNPDAFAKMNECGDLIITVSRSVPVSIKKLDLPNDAWDIEIIPYHPDLTAAITRDEDGKAELTISTQSETELEVQAVRLMHRP